MLGQGREVASLLGGANLNSIQIIMKGVDDKGEKFMGVLLVET